MRLSETDGKSNRYRELYLDRLPIPCGWYESILTYGLYGLFIKPIPDPANHMNILRLTFFINEEPNKHLPVDALLSCFQRILRVDVMDELRGRNVRFH